MKYRAVLRIANGVEAVGYGDNDARAVLAALADSITMRQANPAHVSLSVWQDLGTGEASLSYCSRLSKYLSDTN